MKVLLTIEEYRERLICSIIEVVKRTIIPDAPDYFKWKFIYMLTEEAVTYNITAIDEVNQLFIKIFKYDRNGNQLSIDTLKQIDQEEIDEFESQEWYVKYYEDCRKKWIPYYRLTTFDNVRPERIDYLLFELIILVQRPFVEDINTTYHLAREIFEKLYGHSFEYNKEFKCI